MMKGGAGNILKNIKDTSSKVVYGMQGRWERERDREKDEGYVVVKQMW